MGASKSAAFAGENRVAQPTVTLFWVKIFAQRSVRSLPIGPAVSISGNSLLSWQRFSAKSRGVGTRFHSCPMDSCHFLFQDDVDAGYTIYGGWSSFHPFHYLISFPARRTFIGGRHDLCRTLHRSGRTPAQPHGPTLSGGTDPPRTFPGGLIAGEAAGFL